MPFHAGGTAFGKTAASEFRDELRYGRSALIYSESLIGELGLLPGEQSDESYLWIAWRKGVGATANLYEMLAGEDVQTIPDRFHSGVQARGDLLDSEVRVLEYELVDFLRRSVDSKY